MSRASLSHYLQLMQLDQVHFVEEKKAQPHYAATRASPKWAAHPGMFTICH